MRVSDRLVLCLRECDVTCFCFLLITIFDEMDFIILCDLVTVSVN